LCKTVSLQLVNRVGPDLSRVRPYELSMNNLFFCYGLQYLINGTEDRRGDVCYLSQLRRRFSDRHKHNGYCSAELVKQSS
jgi:hypothetical protein